MSAHTIKLSVACLLLLGVALFFVSEGAEADTIIVDENGNGDYTKIQDAIDASSAGDKIRIWAGNYTENVDVYKRLEVIGNYTDGQHMTTINGNWQGNVLNVSAEYVVLEKLRVIYSQNHTDGVNYIGISVTEDWCEIRNVLVEYNGEGISFSQSSRKNIIDDSILINNSIGLYLHGHNEYLTVGNTTIKGNSEEGVVAIYSHYSEFYYNTITNNGNDGLVLERGNNVIHVGNNISDNDGDGIHIKSESGTVNYGRKNLFRDNIINDNEGSGIFFQNQANNNTFVGNEIKGNKHSVRFRESPDNVFINNVLEGDVWDILISEQDDDDRTPSYNNTFINCTFNPDSIRFDDDGTVVEQNYLEILVYDYANSTVSGADVRIKDNSKVVYSTSYYDGDDATTDYNGLISLIPLTYTIYEYSEDPTTNVTTVEVYYRISNVSRTVNMSTSHTESFSMPFGPEWSYEPDDDVRYIDISQDGEYIVIGSANDFVYLFEKNNSNPIWSYETENFGGNSQVAISADGKYIAAGGDKLYLFSRESNNPIWSYEDGGLVAISEDGEYLALGSSEELLLFHKDSSNPLWSTYPGDGQDIQSISISASGEYIVVGSENGDVYLYDRNSNTPIWSDVIDEDVEDSMVAISSNGDYIVVGNTQEIYLYDKNSSTPIWTYDVGDRIYSVAISANGDYVVAGSAGDDRAVYLFEKNSSNPIWKKTLSSTVYSVSISANGEYVLAGTYNDGAHFFDRESGDIIWSYEDFEATHVALSSDAKNAIIGSHEQNILYTFHNNFVTRPSLTAYASSNPGSTDTDPQLGWFAASDDRSNLTFDVYLDTDSDPDTKVADDITAFYYNTQCLSLDTKYYWKVVATDGDDTVTSSVMNFTVTKQGNIFCISIDDDYDPDTLTIKKGSTVIWTNDDDSLHTVTEDDGDFDSGSIAPGNTWSYTFNTAGTYDYYDQYDDDYDGQILVLVSYPPTATINSISPQIAELDNSVSFSGSGSDTDGTISEYKWTSSIDGSLSTSASFSTTDLSFGNHTINFRVKDNDGVWSDNVTSWVDVRKSPEWSYDNGQNIASIAISADGEYIVAGTSSNNQVRLFGKNSSTPLWSYGTQSGTARHVAISENGDYIVAGTDIDKVFLFGKNSSTPIWTYDAGDQISSVAISANGKYVGVGTNDYKFYLFGKDSNTPLWSFESNDEIDNVVISANGKFIVVSNHLSDQLILFNKNSNTPIWTKDTPGAVKSLDISADGEYIVVGTSHSKVILFNSESSTPVWTYSAGDWVYSVSISANGEDIVAGSNDDKVYLFDKDSSSPLWSYDTEANIESVAISSDGKYISSSSEDNEIIVFAKTSSNPLWSYTTGGDVTSIAICADGKYITAGSADDHVYTFRNNQVSYPSILPYGPRSGTETLLNTNLSWFPGSDDITNLTFDVYLSWVKNDVLNNNSAALVADDITNYTHYATSLTESKKYYWKVVATDGTGSATSKLMNFTVLDTTPPIANITSGPSDPSNYRNATFNFTANENDVTFQCKMDTGDWHSCSSPKTYTNLSDDTTHQFQVKATDSSNNTGDAESWIWKISDLTAPVTSISSGPDNPTNSQNATFQFSSNEDDSTFECRMDSGSWSSCSSPKSYSDLSEDTHSFQVKATDEAGNTGSPDYHNWTIDLTAPVTSISSGPSNPSYNQTASFSFSSNEDDSTFQCKLDSGSWSSCSSPKSYSNLTDGDHVFKVKATDEAGNVGSPTTYSWTIDLIELEWSYDLGLNDCYACSVAISLDGEYIAVGTNKGPNDNDDDHLYFFDKDSNVPLWNYTIGDQGVKIAISADGGYIAAGSGDEVVYFFDKDSSTPLWSYDAESSISSLAFSADGEYLAVGTRSHPDDKIILFDKDSSTPLWTFFSPEESNDVNDVAISADGEYIVASTFYGTLYFFDKDISNPLWSYDTGDRGSSVSISADGEYIAANSNDVNGGGSHVYFFDKDSSTPLWSHDLDTHVLSLSVSADGEYIAVGTSRPSSSVDTLYLFNKDNSTPVWEYDTGGSVQEVSISADGEYISVASDNVDGIGKWAYLFDKDSNTPLWSYSESSSSDGVVHSISISADGRDITMGVSVDPSGEVDDRVYTFKNYHANRPSLIVYGPRSGNNASTDPQLGWFAGSDDRSNLTFDVYLDTNSNPTTKIADDITTLYYNAYCLSLDTKYYWKVIATDDTNSVNSSIMNFTVTKQGNVFCVSIDDDYDPADLTIGNGSTVIWTNDDNSLHTVTGDDDEFDSGSISPGNSWSYTFDTVGTYDYYDQYDDDYDGQIIVLVSYPPTATINSISPQIAELYNSVSFSGSGSDSDGIISEYQWISSIDGTLSSSASFSKTNLSFGNHTITFRVKDNDGVWSDNVTSWVDVRKFSEWTYDVGANIKDVEVSADGEYIVVGSESQKTCLFSKDSSSPLWCASSLAGDVRSVSISANGSYFVVGTWDNGGIYLFSKNSSTPIWTYSPDSGVYSVSISADGEYIVASASEDGEQNIYLFSRDSNTPLWIYEIEESGSAQRVSISTDGEYIAAGTGGSNPYVYFFDKDSSTPLWNSTVYGTVSSIDISAGGDYIAVGTRGEYQQNDGEIYLFYKDSGNPLWNYTTEGEVYWLSMSADGEWVAATSYQAKTFFLFNKDSNTPYWKYTVPDNEYPSDISISADGKYIIASSSEGVYFFDSSNNSPEWFFSSNSNFVNTVSMSADGKYIGIGTFDSDDRIYLIANSQTSRPSVIPYGPRSGSETLFNTTLSWFPGSDDITNLTFDVYLSWVKSDVLNNNSAALVADDITNYTHYATSLTESKKYYWKVVATDGTGSATSKLMNFTVLDTTPPIANITSGPSDPSDSRNATFNFTANENDVTFQCKMDTGDWDSCSSPKTYTYLMENATHQFQVKATDSSNNTGNAAIWIWKISDLNLLVAHWSLDEGSGNTISDSSGNDNDGTIYGDTEWVDGISGSALKFAGDGDYVEISDPEGPTSNKFSISIWFQWDDLASGDVQFLIGKEEEHFELQTLDQYSNPNGIMFIPAGSPDTILSSGNVIHAGWNHVVATYDGDVARIYFDGVLVSSRNISSSDNLSSDDSPILLGKRDGHDDATFRGILDEITLWDYSISESKVEELYELHVSSPIGHWSFDEGSGTTASDSSDNANNGTLQHDPDWVTGISGNALYFNGRNDHVVIEHDSVFNLTSNFTISAWVNPDSLSQDTNSIVSTRVNHTYGSYEIGIHKNQYGDMYAIFTYIDVISEGEQACDALDHPVSLDEWILLTVTKDDNSIKIYINGELSTTCSHSNDIETSSVDLTIGARTYSEDHGNDRKYFNGIIDDVRIWDRAISSDETSVLYDSYGHYVARWTFDEGSGTTASDDSGNDLDAILTNGPQWVHLGGLAENSLQFDGDNDYAITTANPFSNEDLVSGTMSVWIYTETTPDEDVFVFSIEGWSQIAIRSDGTAAGCSDGECTWAESNTQVDDGQWHHVVVTWNGWAYTKIYVDGEYVGGHTNSSGSPDYDDTNRSVVFGFHPNLSDGYFEGIIDNAAIWKHPLSSDEISDIYADYGRMVGHWSFDEGSGTNTLDSSFYQNNGTLKNGPLWVDGISGYALEFDGSNDYVEVENSQLSSTAGTISFWMNPDSVSTDEFAQSYIGGYGGGNQRTPTIAIKSSNSNLIWELGDDALNEVDFEFDEGIWHYATISWSDSGSSIKVYIDGNLVDTGSNTVTQDWSDMGIYVGAYKDGGSMDSFVDGTIDDLQIWDYPLSIDAINEFYHSYDRVILHLTLDENSGTTAYDSSPNGNDGTLTNGPQWVDGIRNSALDFDGDNDYVSVAHHSAFNLTSELTISAWVNPASLSAGTNTIVSTRVNHTYGSYGMGIHKNQYGDTYALFTYVDVISGGEQACDATDHSISLDEWILVTAVKTEDDIKIYVDGNLVQTCGESDNLAIFATPLIIGSYAGTHAFFNGTIDDVIIWNHAITSSQVSNLHARYFGSIVDANGNGDYTSIQDAVNESYSGDNIYVWSGTYYENLIVNKSISLLGNGTNTIINGSYSNYTVWVSADGVVIDGFIIEGTHDSYDSGEPTNNSGLVVYYSDNVTVSNLSFRENTQSLLIRNSDYAIIRDSSFVTNLTGIFLDNSERYVIHHNDFQPNLPNGEFPTDPYACTHNIYNSGTVENVSIHNNTMGACWTGMWLPGVSYSIIRDNVLISDNRSGNGISTTTNYNKFINNTIKYFGIKGFGLGMNADYNLFEDNYLEDNGFDFKIQGGSENNTVVNSIFSKVSVDNTSSLIIKNYLSILVTLDNGTYNVNNADVLIKDNDNVIHASSGFGGSDPKTDNGTIQTYLITDRIYDGSSTATENTTTVKILHGTSISRSVNMSTTHTESINVDRKSIWVVDINGSGDFTTIQQAVTVARAGNELRIWSGVYRETIVIDKSLTLTGNGSANTKIVANISEYTESTNNTVVRITSDETVFQNINITLEYSSNSPENFSAVRFFKYLLRLDGDDITLYNNSFYNYNLGWNRVAVYVYEGENVNISKNKFYNSEWAIQANHADYGLYYNNTFVGSGSHMELLDSSYNIVENNTFYYVNYGLAIHDSSVHNILRYNILIFSSNGTTSLGEVGLTVASHSTDNVLFGNYVSDYKHGIVFRCGYDCEDNTIENNTVDDSKYGITLYANATNNVIIDNVVRNSEKYGIYIQASASSNTFIDNRVSNSDDYDLFVEANSTGTIFIDSDIGNYSIHSSSSLTLMNYLEIKVQGSNGHPISGVDIKIVTGNDIQYSSSHYGGNDAQTDSSGKISEQLLAYRTYEGNTSTNHTTQLYVWYEGIEKVLNRDMTSHRHETINLSFLIVDKNGNGHYTTLEAALSNASAGDTVRIWAGTYYENIIVNKTISFLGNGTNTIINGSYSNYTVWINADRVHIDGFIVEGTLDSSSTSTPLNNSAIVVYYADNVTVSNISFRDNTHSLLIHNSDYVLIEYSSFVTNQSGILSFVSDSYVIHHNDFSPNLYSCGHHIYNSDGGFNARISNNTIGACWTGMWLPGITYSVVRDNILISDNRSSNGIALTGHHNSIINNTIKYFGNKALSPQGNSDYNLFKDNYLEGNFYGFYIEDSSDNNTITNNVIKNSKYGMVIEDSSENHIHNNTISGSDKYGIYIKNDYYFDSSPNNIRFNNIVDSGQYAMFAEEMVNATYNWWGNSTGPGGAGTGSGDAINNRSLISYSPWLCVPADSQNVTYCTDDEPPVVVISSGPDSLTNSQSATFQFSVNEHNSTIQCKLDSGSWGNCTSPKSYSNLSEGSHTFSAKATDIFDNTGATVYHNWTIDITSPITTLTSSIGDLTNSQSATFTFTSNEDNSTFECKLDYGNLGNCTSPKSYSSLSEGNHTFMVWATDQVGNTGSSKSHTWVIDITDPIATITSSPANSTNNQTASFNFTSNEQGSTFECSLDSNNWTSCSSPVSYYNLSEGSHLFEVRATDEANNTGNEAVFNWTVDLSGSSAYISSGPDNPAKSSNATFYIGSYESTDTLQCNLGSTGWSDCTSPKIYYDLSEGNHNFSLRAIDSVGNIGPSAYYNWTTDYTDPVTTITSGPETVTNSTSATFQFVISEDNSTSECRVIYHGGWDSCTSPITYDGLNESNPDSFTFYVRTTDQAGNLGNTATYSWTTDYTAPVVTLTSYPSSRTNNQVATFNFTADESAIFDCSFNNSAWYSCTGPVVFSNLSEDSYSFKVRGTDNVNNTGSPTFYNWVVDVTRPVTTIYSGPSSLSNSDSASFSFSNNEENGTTTTDECNLDGEGNWSECSSPVQYD